MIQEHQNIWIGSQTTFGLFMIIKVHVSQFLMNPTIVLLWSPEQLIMFETVIRSLLNKCISHGRS
jgi:hypothetical protein